MWGDRGDTVSQSGKTGETQFHRWDTGESQFHRRGYRSDKLLIYEILKRHSLIAETQGHWANTTLGKATRRHGEDTVLIEDTRDSGYKRGPIVIERMQGRQKFLKLGQS